jgi:iron complex transport system ATP-binding protein
MTAEAVARLGRFAFGEPMTANAGDDGPLSRALEAADAAMLRTRIVPTLSGGEQARVHLARVFAAEAPVMLLDEPTAALDISGALRVMAILRKKADDGAVILAALHDFALARRYCRRLIVLKGGALVADAPPDAALDEATLATVFEVENDGGHFRPLDA